MTNEMNREEVVIILQGDLHPGPWRIDTPRDGLSKEAFIAWCHDLRVFVKLDVSTLGLKRLADLGVTPALLGSGNIAVVHMCSKSM